jgi:hypothetical protein
VAITTFLTQKMWFIHACPNVRSMAADLGVIFIPVIFSFACAFCAEKIINKASAVNRVLESGLFIFRLSFHVFCFFVFCVLSNFYQQFAFSSTK